MMTRMGESDFGYMERLPLSELKLEQSMEGMFWKQKIWNELEKEADINVLREAIKHLIALCTQRQDIIKSLIQYQMKQDLLMMKEGMKQLKQDPNPELDQPFDGNYEALLP